MNIKKNPADSRFKGAQHPIDTEGVSAKKAQKLQAKSYIKHKLIQRHSRTFFTQVIIALCVLTYIWNGFQLAPLEKQKSGARFYNLTPIFLALAYDIPQNFPLLIQFFKEYPIQVETREDLEKLPPQAEQQLKKIEQVPVWKGLYEVFLKWPASQRDMKAPLFVKISEGQIWRLLSPVFLHGGFLHILFNMLWLYMLGKQIETRIKKWQYLLLTILIGVISNTCQYLVSGPLFIGYSGIICGLAGFIWMRQKKAPWEGYSLQRSALVFLGIFILGMFALQAVSFILVRFQHSEFSTKYCQYCSYIRSGGGNYFGKNPLFF